MEGSEMLTIYIAGCAVWIAAATPRLYKNLRYTMGEQFDAEGFFTSAALASFTSFLWPVILPIIGLGWLGMRLAGISTNNKDE